MKNIVFYISTHQLLFIIILTIRFFLSQTCILWNSIKNYIENVKDAK